MGYGQYSIYGGRKRSNPLANETKPKRQVFPSDEIPHLWAHQTQANARNPQGNFYFRGPVIYSYRESAPLARLTENSAGKRAVLFNSAKWSITTSGQQWAVRRAIPPDMPVFEVPHLGLNYYTSIDIDIKADLGKSTHSANSEHFVREAKESFEASLRAQGRGLHKLEQAFTYREDCRKYCRFFKVKMPSFGFLPSGKKLSDLQARLREKEARANESDAKRRATISANQEKKWAERDAEWKRQQAEREAQLQAERDRLPELIEEWREGRNIRFSYGLELPTMLRIKGDSVETSMGVTVPIDHARRALRLVRTVKRTGKAYQRDGHTFHVGPYAIDSITPDGTLNAGCHHIEWPEIDRIGRDLDGRIDPGELILSDRPTDRPPEPIASGGLSGGLTV